MTRSDALLAAIKAAFLRQPIDGGNLRSIAIEVHFRGGGGHPRSVVIRPEYEEILEVQLFGNGASSPYTAKPVGPPSIVST